MLGSPTALANEKLETMLTNAAKEYGTGYLEALRDAFGDK